MPEMPSLAALALALLIVAVVGGIALVVAICRGDKLAWVGAGAVLLGFIAVSSWMANRDEAVLAAERRADFEAKLARMHCPPRQSADAKMVVLVLDADTIEATGCERVPVTAYMWWHLASGEPPIFAYPRRP